ncbi:hypothetical protein OAU26_03775 [Mariniblastus sp.]|nr:hypothetical protein [Mariniblastus sp.]
MVLTQTAEGVLDVDTSIHLSADKLISRNAKCGSLRVAGFDAYQPTGTYVTGEQELEQVLYNAYRGADHMGSKIGTNQAQVGCALLLMTPQDYSGVTQVGGVELDITIKYVVDKGTYSLGSSASSAAPNLDFASDISAAGGSNNDLATFLPTTTVSLDADADTAVTHSSRIFAGSLSVTATVNITVRSQSTTYTLADASYSVEFEHSETVDMKVLASNTTLVALCGQSNCSDVAVATNVLSLSGGEAATLTYDEYYCDSTPSTDLNPDFVFSLDAQRREDLLFKSNYSLSQTTQGTLRCASNKPQFYVDTTLNFNLGLAGIFASHPRKSMFNNACALCTGSLHTTVGSATDSYTGIQFDETALPMEVLAAAQLSRDRTDVAQELQFYYNITSVGGSVFVNANYPKPTITLFDGSTLVCGADVDPLSQEFTVFLTSVQECSISTAGLEYDSALKTLSFDYAGAQVASDSIRKMSVGLKDLQVVTTGNAFAFDTTLYCGTSSAENCVPAYQQPVGGFVVGVTQCESTPIAAEGGFVCSALALCNGTSNCEANRTYTFGGAFAPYVDQSGFEYQYAGDLLCAMRSYTITDSAAVSTTAGVLDSLYVAANLPVVGNIVQTGLETQTAQPVLNSDCVPGLLTPGATSASCVGVFSTDGGWSIANQTHTGPHRELPRGLCVEEDMVYTATVTHPCRSAANSTIAKQVRFLVPTDTAANQATLDGATYSIITDAYAATQSTLTSVTLTFAQGSSSSVAMYGLFDASANSQCTLDSSVWTCTIGVTTTALGAFEARKAVSRGTIESTLSTHVASGCPATSSSLTFTRNLVLQEYGVVRDTFDTKLFDGSELVGSQLSVDAGGEAWKDGAVLRVPWDTTKPVMPPQNAVYTIQVESESQINKVRISRQSWTGFNGVSDCVDAQKGLKSAQGITTSVAYNATVHSDYVEEISCSHTFNMTLASSDVNVSAAVVGNTMPTSVAYIFLNFYVDGDDNNDVCANKGFTEHAKGSPYTLDVVQGEPGAFDTKQITLNILCGAGVVELGLAAYNNLLEFPTVQPAQLFKVETEVKDVSEPYILRNPFTSTGFQFWQDGSGRDLSLQFTISSNGVSETFNTTSGNNIVTFVAEGCSTKVFTVETTTVIAGITRQYQWLFRVPCLRISGDSVEEEISLDYSTELTWDDIKDPQIGLTGGPGAAAWLQQVSSSGCSKSAPYQNLTAQTSGSYNALSGQTFANESAVFKFLGRVSNVVLADNKKVFTTHLVQKYRNGDYDFCESRQLVFSTLVIGGATAKVTIGAHEQFRTGLDMTRLEWVDDAGCAGKLLVLNVLITSAQGDLDDLQGISADTTLYLAKTHLLYLNHPNNDFGDKTLTNFNVESSKCYTSCSEPFVTPDLKFSLLKYTSSAILGADYTVATNISCYAEPQTINNDVAFDPQIIFMYGTNGNFAEVPCKVDGVEAACNATNATRTIDFLLCDPALCKIKLTLEDTSWVSGFTVKNATVNEVAQTPTAQLVLDASDYSGETLSVAWVYERNTIGRRLRTRRLGQVATAVGVLDVLPYFIMESDQAMDNPEAGAGSHDQNRGGAHASDDALDTTQIVFIVVGSVFGLALIIFVFGRYNGKFKALSCKFDSREKTVKKTITMKNNDANYKYERIVRRGF